MVQTTLINGKGAHKITEISFKNFSWQHVFRIYKNACKQLIFCLALLESQIKISQNLKPIFEQNLSIISTLISYSEFSKFGHKLPLFSYIFNRYQKQKKVKKQLIQQGLKLQLKSNQRQNYYRKFQYMLITAYEQRFLQSKQINQTLYLIGRNQIKLHNPQCIGCSEVFVKQFQIFNCNRLFQTVVGLPQYQYTQINLEKYICAVANGGVGVIILGAQRKNLQLLAVGIRFKQKAQVSRRIQQIYKIITNIKPQIYAYVQNVGVQASYIQKDNAAEQFFRFCFRIIVFPNHFYRKQYVQYKTKGYQIYYQSYELDQQGKPNKNLYSKFDSSKQTFYSLAFKHYLKNKALMNNKLQFYYPNIHSKIMCQKPQMQFEKILERYMQRKIKNYQNHPQEQIQHQVYHEDQPKFKYQYSSLLAVGSKNKDKYIKYFVNVLKAKKIVCELEKPFSNSFKNSSRSIWILSHIDHQNVIRPILKQFDKGQVIRLIPVFKTLQIDQRVFTPQKQQKFRQLVINRYPEGYEIHALSKSNKNALIKDPTFISFNSYNQAIFGYLIFQTLQLRPFFVKQNTTYKKKKISKDIQQKK